VLTNNTVTAIPSNWTDDFPYSWSVPTYHPSTEVYQLLKVGKHKHYFLNLAK